MKKGIFFLMLFACTGAFAQRFEFGLKAGPNFSNFLGSSSVSTVKSTTLLGFHGGAFVNLMIGNHFAVSPEVQLSTQGAKIDDGTSKTNYNLTYVNIPVMLKYRFTGGFYLEAGGQVGINVHSPVNGTGEDIAKSTDLGIAGGLGYHSPIGLGIGARYIAGLSTVGNFDISNTSPDYKNGCLQISLFYTFFNHRK